MTTKEKIIAIACFLAVAIAAYALIVTIVSCFNYAFTAKEGFRAICGAVTGAWGGYAIYRATKWSMKPFMSSRKKKKEDK